MANGRVLKFSGTPSGSFANGETVTGSISGSTGIVIYQYVEGFSILVDEASAPFVVGDVITGDVSLESVGIAGEYPIEFLTIEGRETPKTNTFGHLRTKTNIISVVVGDLESFTVGSSFEGSTSLVEAINALNAGIGAKHRRLLIHAIALS